MPHQPPRKPRRKPRQSPAPEPHPSGLPRSRRSPADQSPADRSLALQVSAAPDAQQDAHRDMHRTVRREFHNEAGLDALSSLPGTLRIPPHAIPPQIYLTDYSPEGLETYKIEEPEAIAPHLDSHSVSWVDVQGLGSEDILRRLGKVFDLHPLVLEDIVNVPQRPKIEEHNNQLLFVARMVCLCEQPLRDAHFRDGHFRDGHFRDRQGRNKQGRDGQGHNERAYPQGDAARPPGGWAPPFVSEQVSFILRENALLTVQEEAQFDSFEQVRERLRLNKGILRKRGPDYLLYALIDAVIDGFFPILETYGELIEELEDEVVLSPTTATLTKIHQLKRELLTLRRSIWPQRDAINSLIRDGNPLISDDVTVYLRDCYDHTVQVLDMVETYRELASSLMDVYLSSVSNRMNEVMKLLTVISSIFIPLTFIAGIYGMNFSNDKSPFNMPELHWYWGYVFCWGLMVTVALGLVFFFYKKGWFKNFSGVR